MASPYKNIMITLSFSAIDFRIAGPRTEPENIAVWFTVREGVVTRAHGVAEALNQ